MKPLYIASCSFGKDSIATILLALEHNEPLDRVSDKFNKRYTFEQLELACDRQDKIEAFNQKYQQQKLFEQ